MRKRIIYFLLFSACMLSSCKINYSLSGASISPDVKTFVVQTFPNNAPLFQPSLSYTLTNALKDKIQSQTSLKLGNSNGDVTFEGEITGYDTRPVAIQANDQAAQTRLTITIKVKFTNTKDMKQDFSTSFTRYEDFDTKKSLNSIESTLIKNIVEQLTEDIFNKAFVNW